SITSPNAERRASSSLPTMTRDMPCSRDCSHELIVSNLSIAFLSAGLESGGLTSHVVPSGSAAAAAAAARMRGALPAGIVLVWVQPPRNQKLSLLLRIFGLFGFLHELANLVV